MFLEKKFRERFWGSEYPRQHDDRDEYQRDRARIIHSAAFRRLQAKTQVMGVGEGDFHRTRLTHSIETGQIGEGILARLKASTQDSSHIRKWLPTNDVVLAACYAHDLGHPPFGHGGEQALHSRMACDGGFEANGQTLRILSRLEKYSNGHGINPTRRLVLAILKYPVPYSAFDLENHKTKPPKCYFDTESDIVEWAVQPFGSDQREIFTTSLLDGKPRHRTLDATIMELADDIAYGVHDLEDIVARKLVAEDDILFDLHQGIFQGNATIGDGDFVVSLEAFRQKLFKSESYERKRFIGGLVNLLITSAKVETLQEFEHPLLRYRAFLPEPLNTLLSTLKDMTYRLVIHRAEIQQLERRGQRIVGQIFDELRNDPEELIPHDAWEALAATDSETRRVCDYIAGMTDPYAEKIYRRLFVPGFGSSRDEL